jgi:hypothetical protein
MKLYFNWHLKMKIIADESVDFGIIKKPMEITLKLFNLEVKLWN